MKLVLRKRPLEGFLKQPMVYRLIVETDRHLKIILDIQFCIIKKSLTVSRISLICNDKDPSSSIEQKKFIPEFSIGF